MRRVAVFVDAGYFWVQVTNVVFGERAQRNQLSIDYDELHKELVSQTKEQFSNADLLRVYWYDGPGDEGKTSEHLSIESLNDFKLRLGTRNGAGAQKAVDGLIIADMISLAQSRAISDALLISGDADLTPGVIASQNLGIRVHLLSIGSSVATSPYLKSEVDYKHHWQDSSIKSFSKATKSNHGVKTSSTVDVVGEDAKLMSAPKIVFDSLGYDVTSKLNPKALIPKEIDKRLLSEARLIIGRTLSDSEKTSVRKEFKKLLK